MDELMRGRAYGADHDDPASGLSRATSTGNWSAAHWADPCSTSCST
ncbi:hypothetical protein GZL_00162 [Streptomyces sp. 769]|nr:hypothetical protein GZL_00162 [Streptomyces sp. 769]